MSKKKNLTTVMFQVTNFIYRHPYCVIADIQAEFPDHTNLDYILTTLESEKKISFRNADSPSSDDGTETMWLEPDTHFLALLAGEYAVVSRIDSRRTRLRANVALAVSILALALSNIDKILTAIDWISQLILK